MSEKLGRCLKCGGPLSQPPTGRPRSYCGPACRQAAAYEIKRLQRRLEALEERASRLRHERETGVKDWLGRTRAEALADVEAEIAAAEERLRALLAGASEGGERNAEPD
jgi:sugar-specific transcriptional regulator TrmB